MAIIRTMSFYEIVFVVAHLRALLDEPVAESAAEESLFPFRGIEALFRLPLV